MSKLKCSVESCANNSSGCCCRPSIEVCGENACDCEQTCCGSFAEKSEAVSNNLRYDFPNETCDIKCRAFNCVYNEDCKCAADQISVEGCGASDSKQTECATFKKR